MVAVAALVEVWHNSVATLVELVGKKQKSSQVAPSPSHTSGINISVVLLLPSVSL